jgi:hypothetical protein
MKSGISSEDKCHNKNLLVEFYFTGIRVCLTPSLMLSAACVPNSENNIFIQPITQITASI